MKNANNRASVPATQGASTPCERRPTAIEALAIGLPLVAHLVLGVGLGLTRRAAFEAAYPDPRSRWAQRASGFYLAMYVVFHVWALRLAPERLSGQREMFDLVAAQLRDPAVFALQGLAVIAAALHFSLGSAALAGPNAFRLSPASARALRLASVITGVLLATLGLHALLAFVWAPARWLAPR